MSRFNEIMKGLQEAIDYENGHMEGTVVHKISVEEVGTFSPSEIRTIRMNANMSQQVFASCIGVTKKAVEAWEGGRSKPDGAARRTIGLLQKNPHFAEDVGILARK